LFDGIRGKKFTVVVPDSELQYGAGSVEVRSIANDEEFNHNINHAPEKPRNNILTICPVLRTSASEFLN
jgi:hypothetical protein